MADLGIFSLEFENNIIILEINTLEFVYWRNFKKKQKSLNLEQKVPLVCYFWARTFKNCCHISNQHPQICLFAKFHEKARMPKFGTKNVWFRYFGAKIWKQYYHIWYQHFQIFLITKFCGKIKMFKVGTKNALLGHFWPRVFKSYCHIWNQHPQICLFANFD